MASLAILVLAAATPWLSEGPRALIQLAYQSLCHQEVERSFGVGGTAFAVCHRCFGIYAGISLGLLGLPAAARLRSAFLSNVAIVLCVALAPLVLDWGLDVVGLWANTWGTRFGTGLLAGTAGGLFLNLAILPRRDGLGSAKSEGRFEPFGSSVMVKSSLQTK